MLEISIVVVLIFINGLLAMSEIAVVSSRPARLQALASSGRRGARTALQLIEDPSRFLSTVQIGITLVGIFAGAYGGATIAESLAVWLDQFPFIAPHGDDVSIGLVVATITFLSLVIGELVPKRIGLNNPEAVAIFVARPMDNLSKLAAPAVWLLRKSTEGVLALLRLEKPASSAVTEEEIKTMIAEGTRAGTFVPQEQEMIEGVLRLADRSVRTVMTPRRDIYWLDLNDSPNVHAQELLEARHSRLVVCDGSVDAAIGLISTKDALAAVIGGQQIDLRALMSAPQIVPQNMPLLRLIEFFRTNAVHIAIVVDEYGITEGLVTTTDLLESIAGQLPQEGTEEAPQLERREDGSWLVDGAMPIDEFADRLNVRGLLSHSGEFTTVAGFALYKLARVPSAGETFSAAGLKFEIVDLDGRRIDKLLVSRHHDSLL